MAELITLEGAVESSKAKGPQKTGGEDRALVSAMAVKNPPAPLAYQYLNVGPELSIEMEDISTDQIDNTRQMLRNLSPFVIQIEPPAAFQSYTSAPNAANSPNIGLYDIANGTASSYQKAREALTQDSFLSGISSKQTSMNPEEFLASSGYKAGKLIGDLRDVTPDNADLSPRGRPALPDLLTVMDMRLQVSNILNIPPLVLLINPASFQIQYTKIQQYQDRSRYGYILHTWGEDQAKVSFTAKCGAFISGGRGVHVASRNDSKSWQNMQNLMRFYKNNGYIYDTMGRSNAHLHIGSLSIRYDGFIYYGSMESFTFELNEDNELGGVEFNIEFAANGIQDTTPYTNIVQPMRAPLPSIEDQRYMNSGKNRPGEYAFGIGSGGGARLTTQGREVSASDALETLIPHDGAGGAGTEPADPTTIGMTGGIADQSVGSQAFRSPSDVVSVDKDVEQGTVNSAKPFGF